MAIAYTRDARVSHNFVLSLYILLGVASCQNLRSGENAQPSPAKVLSDMAKAYLTRHFVEYGEEERRAGFEDELRTTYAALPEESGGGLARPAVRYALHRLFVQRHGWYIKGLEATGGAGARWSQSTKIISDALDWLPHFLQDSLDELRAASLTTTPAPASRSLRATCKTDPQAARTGTNLREVAVLAATFEDLVRHEARTRLDTAFRLHARVTGEAGSSFNNTSQAEDVLQTWLMYYLLGEVAWQNDPNVQTKSQLDKARAEYISAYDDWSATADWFKATTSPHLSATQVGDVESVHAAAQAMGEKYHSLNDRECMDLKSTLMSMESLPGRVRLSSFYNKSLYSHWRFTESADYLRALGALDESQNGVGLGQPKVIIANYVAARTNCLEASDYYALCCRNECEDVLRSLEGQVGAPDAEPAFLADAVAKLSTATVEAPRELSSALLGRLSEVAQRHRGRVPLHGRLFAQWLHHAFPRECPFPPDAASSPQTPDGWMKVEASQEEMQKQVESDVCLIGDAAARAACAALNAEGDGELPWSQDEVLFTADLATPQTYSRVPLFLLFGVLALAAPFLNFIGSPNNFLAMLVGGEPRSKGL